MTGEKRKLALLCVDDEPSILSSLNAQLKRLFPTGILIESAESPEEALEVLEDYKKDGYDFPVIISDYIMPNMYGSEFLKKSDAIAPESNKILLSGQIDLGGIRQTINDSQLYAYIPKPWEEKDLFLTVRTAIEKFEKEQTIVQTNHQLKETNDRVLSLNKALSRKGRLFSRFVPIPLLESLFGNPDIEEVENGICVKENLNVLFCDIQGFTKIAETLELEDCFHFLNSYHGIVSEVIMNFRGIIDSYSGDGVLALFKDSEDVMNAAIEIVKSVEILQPWLEKLNQTEIKLGIGISRGDLMLGTIGTSDRLQTTVIGDTVNMAAKLEKLCRKFPFDIIISENVRKHIEKKEEYNLLFLGKTDIAGKNKKEKVYAYLGEENKDMPFKEQIFQLGDSVFD